VSIVQNEVTSSAIGIALRGAYLQGPGGIATGNVADGIDVVKNTLTGNTIGIELAGGAAPEGGTATANELAGVSFLDNTVQGGQVACTASADTGSGSVGNSANVACPS
jgi:nitrous oxidase accessory protein NosD